jgi:WD40 repeat protein
VSVETMLKRRTFIKEYLNNFIPNVISNLVCEYDYYLKGECDLTLRGHDGAVLCCTVLSNGQNDVRIVSGGSFDKTLRIWNAETGKCELILKGHTDWVSCCATLPTRSLSNPIAKRIVSGSHDNTLKIWHSITGNCELTLEGHSSAVYCCTVLHDGPLGPCCSSSCFDQRIVSGSRDGTIKIWSVDLHSNTILQIETYNVPSKDYSFITDCFVLSDEQILCKAGPTTIILNVETKKCELISKDDKLHCILSNGQTINQIYEKRIHCGGPFNVVSQTGQRSNPKGKGEIYLEESNGNGSKFAILPDGRIIGSIFCPYVLKIWDAKTGKCDLVLKGHTCSVSCYAILPDGRIVTGSYASDTTLKIWS